MNKWNIKNTDYLNLPNSTIEPDGDWEDHCRHPEHNPPMHICIPPGLKIRYKCPGCGKETVIRSPAIYF